MISKRRWERIFLFQRFELEIFNASWGAKRFTMTPFVDKLRPFLKTVFCPFFVFPICSNDQISFTKNPFLASDLKSIRGEGALPLINTWLFLNYEVVWHDTKVSFLRFFSGHCGFFRNYSATKKLNISKFSAPWELLLNQVPNKFEAFCVFWSWYEPSSFVCSSQLIDQIWILRSMLTDAIEIFQKSYK